MSTEKPEMQDRGSFLSLVLAFLGTGGFVGFLILLSNGLLLYMMLGVFCFAGVGLLHYLLWGHTMSQQVARERQALEMRLEEEARQEVE